MKTIYKYGLDVTDYQIIKIPYKIYQILTVQIQHGKPCIWVMLDNSISHENEVVIYINGTGHNMIDVIGDYLGTFQLNDGDLIFHVSYNIIKE